MRANLLGRSARPFRAGPISVDVDLLREVAAGLTVVAFVFGTGTWIGAARIARLSATADRLDADVARNAGDRDRMRRLLVDVARLQACDRDAQTLRRSGTDAALEIARVGNAIGYAVWLDGIERNDSAYAIAGRTRALARLPATLVALGRALPDTAATIVSIDDRGTSATIRFTARISNAPRTGEP